MEIIFCTMLSIVFLALLLIESSMHNEKSQFDIWREICNQNKK